MPKYNPKDIEKKWQKHWEENKTFSVKEDPKKKKWYSLIEFPYPSGEGLHVGHPRPFTAMDAISRKRRMEGYNVLYPIGFDAFGLPTENHAIKTKQAPAVVTKKNIANFTRQLKLLGYSFDWDRVVDTTDPKYFKWTQWLFLQFFKSGLAYKKNQPINWCPKDKIGLANEEVVNGCCERCGTAVEQRSKEQWMLAITKYAEKLLQGLKEVDYITPARVQQENWIGKSEGALVEFKLENSAETIKVFTTRPDTLFGATYMVISPEHKLIEKIKDQVSNFKEIEKYQKEAKMKSDLERTELQKEKTGVELKGVKAVNPVNGKNIPIFVADYVLASYGTGAIMAVPAHDERDHEFAKKYNIEIVEVVAGGKDVNEEPFVEDGKAVNSDFLNGLGTEDAKQKMIEWLEKKNIGEKQVNYKLRDWVFSRQRYWGEPIPLVYCEACAKAGKFESQGEEINPGWIPDEKLPLELPKVEKYEPTDTGESPLAPMTDWVNTKCPRCGGKARRETDTMPNWAGSSWYFLRYTDPHNDKEFASKKNLEYWMNINWYNGGMEHTVLHLLYSRFWNQFLYDQKLVPTLEPYAKRTSHGMILGPDGEKMSKSRGNVINPDEMVEKFGTDAFRTYIMFMGPFDQAVMWDTNGLIGVRRFLDKIWNISELELPKTSADAVVSKLHQLIKKVGEDIDKMRFNTAIAAMMEFVNFIYPAEGDKEGKLSKKDLTAFIKLLSPFAPHLAEELWEKFGDKKELSFTAWPEFDEKLAKEKNITVAVQVNGKVRDELTVDADISENDIKELAVKSEKVQKWLEGKAPKKVIYVKGKLVSVVV